MAHRDGDGWVDCSCGSRHWGVHGAAGVLVLHFETQHVLMQRRAKWTHAGGTWGIPGGAVDSHEEIHEAALREFHEEAGVEPHAVEVLAWQSWTDHGQWRYHTVIAKALLDLDFTPNDETDELAWVALEDVASLDLIPGLAQVWGEILLEVKRLISLQ